MFITVLFYSGTYSSITVVEWCEDLMMSLAKQIGLVAAGCQPWNLDVCAASGDRFAYCATLAIYIYQVQQHLLIFVGIT